MIRGLTAALLVAAAPAADQRAGERELMVLTIESLAATAGIEGVERIDRSVLDAMRRAPRHLLAPEEVRVEAYENRPLPIGHDATISQPFIVALMTHLLDVRPDHIVLEIGTGSGYQAAVLATLARHVCSVEIVHPLAERAARDLAKLGYVNVTVRAGDGYAGWPERAPFDRIIVTAGTDHAPQPLLDQLKPGGRMVIPLGPSAEALELTVIAKVGRGRITRRRLLPVRFVPLTRSD